MSIELPLSSKLCKGQNKSKLQKKGVITIFISTVIASNILALFSI